MGMTIKPDEFRLMQDFIEKTCGIRVGNDKEYLVESRLGNLVIETGCSSFNEFYLKLRNGQAPSLADRVIDLITTNETLWFRDTRPFTVIKEKILPEYAQEIREGKRRSIRIWSCASSTGQEPYSIAMIILDMVEAHPHLLPHMFEILATDIATSVLKTAMTGRYDKIAISRGLPPDYLERYFRDEGRFWSVADEVKKLVTFKKFNLQDSFAGLGRFDIILCRNVAIYFSDSFKRALFEKFEKALAPNGYFFLGASESISAYSASFEMLEHGRGIYYRHRLSTLPAL